MWKSVNHDICSQINLISFNCNDHTYYIILWNNKLIFLNKNILLFNQINNNLIKQEELLKNNFKKPFIELVNWNAYTYNTE